MKNIIIIIALCLIGAANCFVPGGFFPVSIDDPQVVNLTSKAVEYHNQISNSANYKKLVRIQNAQAQVVAGSNYEITFIVGYTDCAKTNVTGQTCNISANTIPEECTYKILVPLNNQVEITRGDCKLTQAPTFSPV